MKCITFVHFRTVEPVALMATQMHDLQELAMVSCSNILQKELMNIYLFIIVILKQLPDA